MATPQPLSFERGEGLELLSPDALDARTELKDRFTSSSPFPHLVLDSFLEQDYCRRLLQEFPRFEDADAKNELGKVGAKAVRWDLPQLGPAYAKFDRLMRSEEFLQYVSDITGIPHLLYDPEYVGGGTHENAPGQELDPHIDFNYHPRTGWHRRLNLLLFLNQEWDDSWGGSLDLHSDPRQPPEHDYVVTITPLRNRCVLFETSERSWHGFKRIAPPKPAASVTRRSIAVYFYTDDLGGEARDPSHSTMYIQRPLPQRFREGYRIDADNLRYLRELLFRRDHQIDFLYEREKISRATAGRSKKDFAKRRRIWNRLREISRSERRFKKSSTKRWRI